MLFTIAGFGCAFAPSLELLGFFRATQGIAFALKSVILVGFVAFIVPHDYVGTAVGFFTIASTVASALAPTVGELVGSTFGYSNSFLVAGCFYLFGFILILLFKLPDAARQVEEERKAKRAALLQIKFPSLSSVSGIHFEKLHLQSAQRKLGHYVSPFFPILVYKA